MSGAGYSREEEAAARASALLFRIGFAILVIAMPIAAVASRRAVVVLGPVGAGILFFASLLMPERRDPFVARMGPVLGSAPGLAGLFLVGWSVLTLAWTPFPEAAAERLARISGILVLALGAALALPERMRASNLYLMALGAAAAGLLWLSAAAGNRDVDALAMERARIVIILLAWPSVAWLAFKRRAVSAMLVAGIAGGMALVGESQTLLVALLVGAVVLGGAFANGPGAVRGVAVAMAAIVLAGPAVALLSQVLPAASGGEIREWQIWGEIIRADPSRLVTGHGVETSLRNRFVTGSLDQSAPTSLVFELWYELGVLGAVAAAVLLAGSVLALRRQPGPAARFALGAMAFTFTLALLGFGTQQTWWLTALSATAIAFAGVANGTHRTSRPTAKTGLRL
jgi:hypothetical protein